MNKFLIVGVVVISMSIGRTTADSCTVPNSPLIGGSFGPGFLWGAASSAYQTEGCWKSRGVNIWDTYCHQPNNPVAGNGTGDVADDSCHQWPQDIAMLKRINANTYRMSISWARILPTGKLSDGLNLEGVLYYQRLMTKLRSNGIQILVLLYHWDLPQNLQNEGGWLNPQIVTWFGTYASISYSLFGKYVKYWVTVNEPYLIATMGYGTGEFAPQVGNCSGTCPYQAGHNLLKAHAQAYHAYFDFRKTLKGSVGIILNSEYMIPATSSAADVNATARAYDFKLGWFAHPIFSKAGDYPPSMKQLIGSRSVAQGYNTSRLPTFTPYEIRFIQGTADFMGMGLFTSSLISDAPGLHNATANGPPNFAYDSETTPSSCQSWPKSTISGLRFTAWGARGLLKHIKATYSNPAVIVTASGWPDNNGTTYDPWRINFYKQYANNVLQAKILDGVNVIGYIAWALLDNFEWAFGYTQKFGLVNVDYNSPNKTRSLKLSGFYYASLVKANGFSYCQLYPNSCQNGGACVSNGNNFTCNCPNGWAGTTCTIMTTPVHVTNNGVYVLRVRREFGASQTSNYVARGRQISLYTNTNSTLLLNAVLGRSTSCHVAPANPTVGISVVCSGTTFFGFKCTCSH